MIQDRELLKRAASELLDILAVEHEARHQNKKVNRYVLTSTNGARVEVMFEKNEESPPNIWCLRSAAGPDLIDALKAKDSPRSGLASSPGSYGRHSALKAMPQLVDGDLVRFSPRSLEELGRILDRLRYVTPKDLT